MCDHNPINRRQEGRKWVCRDCKNKWMTEWHLKLRAEVVAHYGGRCVCCGEDWPAFLQFDHIDGGGGSYRKSHISWSGNRMPTKLKQAGYPDDVQILCANCNTTKGIGRHCPPDHDERARNHGVNHGMVDL